LFNSFARRSTTLQILVVNFFKTMHLSDFVLPTASLFGLANA